MTAQSLREERGQAIARLEGQVRKISENQFKVHSQSGDYEYDVVQSQSGLLSCSCPDAMFREQKCKHQWGVFWSLKLREAVSKRVVLQPINSVSECGFCHSQNIKTFGIRHNKSGDIQRFSCSDCHKTFSVNIGFEKMKHDARGVTMALQLYFSGESLRSTARSLNMIGMNVSHQTVHDWITKYVSLMEKAVDRIVPQVSDKWRADEMYVKFSGNMKYVFAVMDDETRFRLAQEVAHWKEDHDTKKLFRDAKEVAEKSPKELVTDGLPSYHSAYREVFAPSGTIHTKEIQIDGQVHNNKMERQNGEWRDRERVMRGLKKMDTPILKGIQIYHNFVRPHEGLDGDTPADRAGIIVEGANKWLTLIQNASRNG
jgi:putative transposase